MKRLFLVRHAKSSWKHQGLTDFERPLNKRGQRDAPEMGARLAGKEIVLDLMVSSRATRAITTARVRSRLASGRAMSPVTVNNSYAVPSV